MHSVETVSVGAWIGTGSRHETIDLHGVSHLLEHMVFKGTGRRSARDIAEEIEAVGGHLNAYTSREHTAFYAKVLKEDVALAVDIIADLVQNAALEPEELERERSVIIQEINQASDTPDDIVFDHFQEAAYPGQGLGRAVLGTADSVGGMPRDGIARYMHKSYSAPRTVIAAAGRIDHDSLTALAAQAFASLPAYDAAPLEASRYLGGEFRGERDLEQVQVVMGFPGVAFDDKDFYTASVLSTLFGGGMSSRLFQEAREKRGLCYSIYSFLSCYSDNGLFAIHAGTGEDDAADLLDVVCAETRQVMQSVSEAEVARARAQLKASILMSLESTSSRCEQAARQVMVYGRALTVEEVIARIEAVDAERTAATARRLFAGPVTLASLGPITAVPSLSTVQAALA
jgi:predicted Zn-dependent peptidase